MTDPLAEIKQFLDTEIVGEDDNKQILFLVCLSSLTKNPLSCVVKGLSSGGKSRTVNKVLDIFRDLGMVIEFSRITPAFLENMAKGKMKTKLPLHLLRKGGMKENEIADLVSRITEKEPNTETTEEDTYRLDLTGKILFIDELRGIQNLQAPKLMISEGRLRLGTVINGQAFEIEIIGTPSIITTTTLAALEDPEFENRVLPLQIDESKEQTGRVVQFQAIGYEDPSADLTRHKRLKAITYLIKKLNPYDVANPYAAKIAEDYPKKNIEARRDYPKLMNLVKVLTYLNQDNRILAKKGLDLVLVATEEDNKNISILAKGPLQESLTGLSEKEQKILDLEGWNLGAMTVPEVYSKVHSEVRRGEQWVRDHVNRLVDEGYLRESDVSKKPYKYVKETLQPEQLKIELGDKPILEEWAAKCGYVVIHTENRGSLSHPKMSDWDESKPKSSPNPEFGDEMLPAGRFGDDMSPDGLPPLYNESMGTRACLHCHTVFPDDLAWKNHLDTMPRKDP